MEIFDQIADHLNLLEKDYFGLSFRDQEDVRTWLILDRKVSKQIRSKFLSILNVYLKHVTY